LDPREVPEDSHTLDSESDYQRVVDDITPSFDMSGALGASTAVANTNSAGGS
jgi:hypothetical protein